MAAVALEELGVSGLEQFGGYVYGDPLPELRTLQARAKVYKEMAEGDAVVGGILFAIDMLCRNVSWHVDPFDTTDVTDGENATFVSECLNDMSTGFEDTLSEILTFIPYGFAPMNDVYKLREGPKDDDSHSRYNDGRVGWRNWNLRSQDTVLRWDFDPDTGKATALIQQAPPKYQVIPIPFDNLLLFRTTAKRGNPEGRSAIRSAYRSWYYKKHIESIEGIGIERDLAGLPVAWVPPGLLVPTANSEQVALRESIKNIITGIRRDDQEGIIWPLSFDANGNKLYDLTLLSTGGTRQFDTDKVINRYDTRIAMTVLADFILLGHQAVGSWALASSKTNLFSYALGSFLDIVADVINRFAIPRLFRYNGLPLDRLPVMRHGDIEAVDLAELGAFVTAITGAGVVLDNKAQQWILEQAGIPHEVEEDNVSH